MAFIESDADIVGSHTDYLFETVEICFELHEATGHWTHTIAIEPYLGSCHYGNIDSLSVFVCLGTAAELVHSAAEGEHI